MVDLVDMLRARPTIVDPINATAQPFATWTAEGLSFAQPAASSALTQPRTIPDAAALILAVTALAELSRWPAAVSTSHTAVIADLARNEAMGGLRLAALYDLRVRALSGRSGTVPTGPRQSHVDHEWRAGRDHWRARSAPFTLAQHRPRRCPHAHHEPHRHCRTPDPTCPVTIAAPGPASRGAVIVGEPQQPSLAHHCGAVD